MEETLVRRDPITGAEVPRCDIPEEVILHSLRGKLHTVHVHIEPGRELLIEARLPSFDAADITIDVLPGCLRIQAERCDDEENAKYVVRGSSSFYRSVTLPPEAAENLIAAHFHDGVLRVTVPLGDLTTHPAPLFTLPRTMKHSATQGRRHLSRAAEETLRASFA